ncbi:YcdB/YcdC domain-containing protein [Lutispora thermophila]|uniref:Peptidase propeptide and YPEB domain-containing protein n=1 Tax=Lutispora thermophila DSM 19022 TaxID=1122184 RepID=A0A1M6EV63_9FIRM|nr:YcdB/YcdC domain-containing protein [Lutispora thermophila]SHI89371.1 Peptidase propeptide and YPEB domain-containing protein [Lutispora thermophila DSM 19022]
MKRALSLFLVLALLFSNTSVIFAQAKENQSKISLQKAIEIARESFEFNSQGYDFNQSYYENADGTKQWYLNWTSKSNGDNISITIDADTGDVISMYQWKEEYSTPTKLAKYSYEEALKEAEAIVKKLQPKRYKEMELMDNSKYGSTYYYDSNTYYFYYIRKVDNIPFQGDGINIAINKNTLEVYNYNFTWSKMALPDASKALSLEEAKKIFKEKNGIELAYIIRYDQKTKKNTAKLVYTFKNDNLPIDAITGEIINQGHYAVYDASAAGNVQSAKEAVVLTPEENREVENNEKYLKKEKAIEIAKKYVNISDKHSLEAASLYSNYDGSGAKWSFSWSYNIPDKKEYSYVNISLDAVTGKVVSLSSYNSHQDEVANNGNPKYNMDKAKELAENFLNAIDPERFSQTEYRPNLYQNNEVDNPISYTFNFIRKVNGIACPGNYLNVTVNVYTGEITYFYSYWTEIEFPKPDNLLTLEAAYDALYKNVDFHLNYINYYDYKLKHPNNKVTKLVYSFDSFSGMFDPKTGKLLDYNGDIIKDKKDNMFEDIKGHWAENDIITLLEAGIIETNGKSFAPDENIKQKDFIKMLINSLQPNYRVLTYDSSSTEEYDDYYKQAISRKIITEKEKNLDSEVTRAQAAKMIVKAMNLGYIADNSEIFLLGYSDKDSVSKEMRGYVAIATGLNIMSGKGDGRFAPNDKLTRAETATTIVRFLKVGKE